MSGIENLSESGLFEADRAFLDSQAAGDTVAVSVRHALAAYTKAVPAPDAMVQVVASLPEQHPDLAGGQVLVRSFDGGLTWEVCTRPDHYATWSVGVQAEEA